MSGNIISRFVIKFLDIFSRDSQLISENCDRISRDILTRLILKFLEIFLRDFQHVVENHGRISRDITKFYEL